MEKIYLDNASTTALDPIVLEAMMPFLTEHFGNASSPHSIGQQALRALEDARASIAKTINTKPSELVFNSGATEGNNHAIFGLARAKKDKGRHIIISSMEHHSVLEPVEQLERDGYRVSYVKVDETGRLDPNDVKAAIQEDTILIAVIHASNEIGTIQPIKEIGLIAKEAGIPFLVDATQTVGHLPVDVKAAGIDLLTFSAHKFYGPKGVGALYIREGVKLEPLLFGGDQEMARRASTVNVAGVVGMARALEICTEKMDQESSFQKSLRDKLIKEVPRLIEGTRVNGHLTERLANNAHFSFDGIEGESLLMSLDMNGIAASMGSACTSGSMEASHVLRAIGLSDELAYGSLRISLGRWNTQKEIDTFLEVLPSLIKQLRN